MDERAKATTIERLARSWEANAAAWIEAVDEGRIPSRVLATNAAILESVLSLHPRRALDLGCGEGWLSRALTDAGVEAVGVDGSVALINRASAKGGGRFKVSLYSDIEADPSAAGGAYDAIVCNFSLLHEDLAPLLEALRTCLTEDGKLVIQTVHPWTTRGEDPYCDGWKTESFARLGEGFEEPMPWYYRTMESWVALLSRSGFLLHNLREPVHPETHEPLSLLLVAVPAQSSRR